MIAVSNGRITKHVPTGYSWTTFFFGFFPALFRGDVKWALIILLAGVFSFGISNIIIAFFYNARYLESLYEQGYIELTPAHAGINTTKEQHA